METKHNLLIVEDEKAISNLIATTLETQGYHYEKASNGAQAMLAVTSHSPEVILLDLGLPGKDGLEILQSWRQKGRKEAVLILTARGDVDQRITGLNLGADDYLGKPFSLKEVQARLNALIRRQGGQASPLISHKNVTFNPQTRKVTLNGKEITLSPKELIVLELLLLNKNKVLSKETIENKIYSWDDEVQSNAVEVHIHHLRKKLGKDIVKTINKIGYVLEDE